MHVGLCLWFLNTAPKSLGVFWVIQVSFVLMRQLWKRSLLDSFKMETGHWKDQPRMRSLELTVPVGLKSLGSFPV